MTKSLLSTLGLGTGWGISRCQSHCAGNRNSSQARELGQLTEAKRAKGVFPEFSHLEASGATSPPSRVRRARMGDRVGVGKASRQGGRWKRRTLSPIDFGWSITECRSRWAGLGPRHPRPAWLASLPLTHFQKHCHLFPSHMFSESLSRRLGSPLSAQPILFRARVLGALGSGLGDCRVPPK